VYNAVTESPIFYRRHDGIAGRLSSKLKRFAAQWEQPALATASPTHATVDEVSVQGITPTESLDNSLRF